MPFKPPKAQEFNNHLLDAIRYGMETYIYTQADARVLSTDYREKVVPGPVGSPDGSIIVPGLDIGKILAGKTERDWRSL